ncbi:MAG: LUD domain-containing protein [Deltaproteobacteria bacterium]|nr:LUD domain-containing protein [Deltaproteobacteria bacterium]
MSSEARSQILRSLKSALATAEPPAPTGDRAVLKPAQGNWAEAAAALTGLGDHLEVVGDAAALWEHLAALLARHQVSRVVYAEHPLLTALDLPAWLAAQGLEAQPADPSTPQGRDFVAGADLGITAAEALFSDSGTLVLRAGPGRARATSLLPPLHLALVTREQVGPTQDALSVLLRTWQKEEGDLPSGVILITGHSRTADIELILVSGVHGPGRLEVVGLDFSP